MANFPSRYDLGVNTIEHKGVKVTTSLNTDYELLLERIPESKDYKVGRIVSYIVHRPDYISNIFYNTPAHWWYLLTFNNIRDPFEGFNPNDRILIPDINAL